MIIAVLYVLLASYVRTSLAWGADGHHITCLLAESLLSPSAEKAVASLLPEYAQGSLTSLCTWPDDIKWQWKYQWTSALHYIDTPDFLCRYSYVRDCHDEKGTRDVCVAGGINNYTQQLSFSPTLPWWPGPFRNLQGVRAAQYNLTEALLFLAHFVGDIHQPLHVGFTSDMGGNTIMVHWYTRKYNLHHIWDTEIINSIKTQFYNSDILQMAYALHRNITGEWKADAFKWAQCEGDDILGCTDRYAEESINLACKYAYRNATPGSILEDDYYYSRLPIVQQRLAQGGVNALIVGDKRKIVGVDHRPELVELSAKNVDRTSEVSHLLMRKAVTQRRRCFLARMHFVSHPIVVARSRLLPSSDADGREWAGMARFRACPRSTSGVSEDQLKSEGRVVIRVDDIDQNPRVTKWQMVTYSSKGRVQVELHPGDQSIATKLEPSWKALASQPSLPTEA